MMKLKKRKTIYSLNRIPQYVEGSYRIENHELRDSNDNLIVYSSVSCYENLISFIEHWWSILINLELDYLAYEFKNSELNFERGMTKEDITTQLKHLSADDLKILEDNLGYLNVLYQIQEELPLLPERKVLVIDLIEALEHGTGQGTELVKSYQSEFDSIFLYGELGAEDYWEKQGFTPFANGYYLWSRYSDLINLITNHL